MYVCMYVAVRQESSNVPMQVDHHDICLFLSFLVVSFRFIYGGAEEENVRLVKD